jgi:hypothetical protein
MNEPEFYNETPFTAEFLPIIDKDGAECRVAVIKAAYQIPPGGDPLICEKQRPIRYGDAMWGPPEIPDVKYPGDLCCFKPATDFLLVGHAASPGERPVKSVDVEMKVGSWTKTLRVLGERRWRKGLIGATLSNSEPMVRVPLAWSLAFGGFDSTDPKKPVEEPRNPVGRGITRHAKDLDGLPGPQIEDPRKRLSTSADHPTPVGCGPLGRSFEPRRTQAGSYDDAWLQSRFPGRPLDYKDDHENCAPRDQVFNPYLRGGEPIQITGVAHDGPLAFRLPLIRILVEGEMEGKREEHRPPLDTVLVDSDARVVEMVWRQVFRCPPKMRNHFTLVRVLHKVAK